MFTVDLVHARRSFALLAFFLLPLAGCGDTAPADRTGDSLATEEASAADAPAEPDSAQRAHAREVGGEATAALVQTLGGQLQAALREGGAVHAVDFCADRAQALTDSVSRELGPHVRVSRTALRVRNPTNAPDPVDRRVLEELMALQASGSELPGHAVRSASGGEELRFYRPLPTAEACVTCHGPVETLDPELLELIRDRYPQDEAVGFQEGDLRGVVKVTMPVP